MTSLLVQRSGPAVLIVSKGMVCDRGRGIVTRPRFGNIHWGQGAGGCGRHRWENKRSSPFPMIGGSTRSNTGLFCSVGEILHARKASLGMFGQGSQNDLLNGW